MRQEGATVGKTVCDKRIMGRETYGIRIPSIAWSTSIARVIPKSVCAERSCWTHAPACGILLFGWGLATPLSFPVAGIQIQIIPFIQRGLGWTAFKPHGMRLVEGSIGGEGRLPCAGPPGIPKQERAHKIHREKEMASQAQYYKYLPTKIR